jgi:hypothetical protein
MDDYVTEKLLQGFAMGRLPVYWGAPNVDDYLPGPHSIINAMDFAGPRELADHLIKVDEDDELYLSYFKWREQGLSKRFLEHAGRDMIATGADSFLCRSCQYFAQQRCDNA